MPAVTLRRAQGTGYKNQGLSVDTSKQSHEMKRSLASCTGLCVGLDLVLAGFGVAWRLWRDLGPWGSGLCRPCRAGAQGPGQDHGSWCTECPIT